METEYRPYSLEWLHRRGVEHAVAGNISREATVRFEDERGIEIQHDKTIVVLDGRRGCGHVILPDGSIEQFDIDHPPKSKLLVEAARILWERALWCRYQANERNRYKRKKSRQLNLPW